MVCITQHKGRVRMPLGARHNKEHFIVKTVIHHPSLVWGSAAAAGVNVGVQLYTFC